MPPVREMSNITRGNNAQQMFSLAGQTAIVTGAATGIGQAIAGGAADAGATVAVLDLNLEWEVSVWLMPWRDKSFAVEADVADACLSSAGQLLMCCLGQGGSTF